MILDRKIAQCLAYIGKGEIGCHSAVK